MRLMANHTWEARVLLMQSTMSQRLREARLRAKLTLEQAGEALGISAPSVHAWETDDAKPRTKRLEQIARLYDVSVAWLLTGTNLHPTTSAVRLIPVQRSGGRTVPKLTLAEAATGQIPSRDLEFVSTYYPCSQSAYVIEIADSSNTSSDRISYDVGDHATIDPEESPEPGDMVLVVVHGQLAPLLRRYRPLFDGTVTFAPLNPDWPEIVQLTADQFQILGPVVEHARAVKRRRPA